MAFYLFGERKIIKINMLKILYLLLEVLVIIVPVLLAVAFMTIIERKALASFQRRVGPVK
jgi:NADH-ubiquinone oxidoreductase chain 1